MWAELGAVGGFFAGVGVVYTAPLAGHLSSSLPYLYVQATPGRLNAPLNSDTIQLYYCFWLFKDSLLHLRSPLQDWYEFVAGGARYQINMWGFPLVLPYVPLALLFGDIAAYNLIVLLTFPLSALPMHALGRTLTNSRLAAVLAATLWACNPWRVAKLLVGHLFGFLF